MMESEEVSVVITIFNRADTIAGSIWSVLNQSFTPQRVIVVDDGSVDNTPEVLNGFGKRIRVIRQANKGIAAARNEGVVHSIGNWIAFQDSDDEWYPFKLGLQLKVMLALSEVKFIFSDVDAVGERGKFPKKIRNVFADFESRFGLGLKEFFPYGITLRELGIAEPDMNSEVKVYYGPIFKHMWVDPFIINSTVLMHRDSVTPYQREALDNLRCHISLIKCDNKNCLVPPTAKF